jgi:uncharacterized membrane protein
MFFSRIYARGKRFKPSWQSYATYAAIIAGCLLAVEFNVLNVFPGNPGGQLLLIVPAFYFVVAAAFLLNDAVIAGWRLFKGKRRTRRQAS